MLRGAKQSMQKSGYKNCRTHAFHLFNPAFAAKTLLNLSNWSAYLTSAAELL
jgi:hypothetical protein